MRRFRPAPFWLAAVLVCGTGCVTPAVRVLTSVNAYHFNRGEYETRCAPLDPAPPECRQWYADLVEHKRRFTAAQEAIARGGKLPLQLKAMKAAEKAAARK